MSYKAKLQEASSWDTIHNQKATECTTCKQRNSPLVKMLKLMKCFLELGSKEYCKKKYSCFSETISRRGSRSSKRSKYAYATYTTI